MEVRTESRFEQARQDVSRIFASPVELCDAPDLSTDEKVYLLKQWETDLRLLLVASEENMPGTHPDVRFGAVPRHVGQGSSRSARAVWFPRRPL